jgi:hypothetical protein
MIYQAKQAPRDSLGAFLLANLLPIGAKSGAIGRLVHLDAPLPEHRVRQLSSLGDNRSELLAVDLPRHAGALVAHEICDQSGPSCEG